MRTFGARPSAAVCLLRLTVVVGAVLCVGPEATGNEVLPFTPKRFVALGMIESGNNDRARGEAGEISRVQIHPSVWRAYSRSRDYHDPSVSAEVARRHWDFLVRYFVLRTGRVPTDLDLYVLWNTKWGYYERRAFRPLRVHPVVADRAQRFANLVGSE